MCCSISFCFRWNLLKWSFLWNCPVLQIPRCTRLWTHISCDAGYFFQYWRWGKGQRPGLTMCLFKWVQRSHYGGNKPPRMGSPTFDHSSLHHTIFHDEAWPSVSPPAIQHLGKAPAPEVGSQVGKSMREMTQSAPIFLWSSALSMHCPDLTAEKPHARGPKLRWGGPQSSLYLESLPQRAILAEGPRCPSSAAWLILKLELGIILEEWVS